MCVIQSEEYLLAAPVEGMTEETSQTTGFVDAASGVTTGAGFLMNEMETADAVTSAGLSEFLSRPVRISTFTWAQSDPTGVLNSFSPWQLFFNNASIKYKLNNYAFIRANLHLKFVVNASPFFYGSMRACYQPLPEFKTSTIVGGAQGGVTNPELIPYSQQPGVWIKPQHSEGATMVLPFLLPRSFLRVQSAIDFTNMGTVRMLIYNALKSANGVTGTGVSVQVYAWAEDVVLAGPSVGLALQADEYGLGPVSGPATTVAKIAGMLKKAPIIGKFATATEIGAKAMSGIAQLFGFTNVPVIEEARPFRPAPFPHLATAQIGYPLDKLSLDPKNELTVDPGVVGMSSEDELAIQNFATRQSYLTSAVWSTATPVDTPLFTAAVTPNLAFGDSSTGARNYNTPMSLCAGLFRSWRGDIIFTFRFISSPFHKGRVRVSFDPYGTGVQTTGDTGPTVMNKIVDLGAETEVEFRIPYQQALAWNYCYTSVTADRFSISATPTVPYTESFDNGIISVKVLTSLSAPVATSNVEMQVFVRAADNIEFANPATVQSFYTPFQLQSEEYSESRTGQSMTLGQSEQPIDIKRSRTNFGENVRSLRVLMRRMNWHDDVYTGSAPATAQGVFQISQTRFPLYYGYDPSGIHTMQKQLPAVGSVPGNFVSVTPWHMIANCFVGQRGSFNWSYDTIGTYSGSVHVSRDTFTLGGVGATYLTSPEATTNSALAKSGIVNATPTTAGSALVKTFISGGVNVCMPNYTAFKFQTTDPANSTNPGSTTSSRYDGSVYEGHKIEFTYATLGSVTVPRRIRRYCGIGADYTVLFFLNCPVVYSLPESLVLPG